LTVRRDFTRAGSIGLAFSAEMRVEYRSMVKAFLESSCAGWRRLLARYLGRHLAR
jgi:hypothetical protein